MASLSAVSARAGVVVAIGGLPILLRTNSPEFVELLERRYAGFVSTPQKPQFEFRVDLAPRGRITPADDIEVDFSDGRWSMRRGDFRADWDPAAGCGTIRQTPNPYAIDTVLRIFHTLLLAHEGGFLVHAASVVRNGRGFLFAGASGAGKTTISRLAPADVLLLTDEVSYVRRVDSGYSAFGTPFAGELAKIGENVHAPIDTLFLLAQGSKNKIETIAPAEAARALLRCILFFANDATLVSAVFQAACDFVSRVLVRRLTFVPDSRVWEFIQ